MRAVVQRVSGARVLISGGEHARIGRGLMVLVGIEREDTEQDASYLARKIVDLRVFHDSEGRMSRSVAQTHGSILAVSQFTLLGDCRKGRRPSFDHAAPPDEARGLYETLVRFLGEAGIHVQTGVFGEMMEVELTNDGPVTLLLDSRKKF